MLWVLFEKPYEVEWEYVHAYNPDWFNVPQRDANDAFSYIGFLSVLENPISMEDFNQGMNFVYNQFRNEKVVNTTTPEIITWQWVKMPIKIRDGSYKTNQSS